MRRIHARSRAPLNVTLDIVDLLLLAPTARVAAFPHLVGVALMPSRRMLRPTVNRAAAPIVGVAALLNIETVNIAIFIPQDDFFIPQDDPY